MPNFNRIPPVGLRCKWCGLWHYGHSNISSEYATNAAQAKVDACRTQYERNGWPAELAEVENVG